MLTLQLTQFINKCLHKNCKKIVSSSHLKSTLSENVTFMWLTKQLLHSAVTTTHMDTKKEVKHSNSRCWQRYLTRLLSSSHSSSSFHSYTLFTPSFLLFITYWPCTVSGGHCGLTVGSSAPTSLHLSVGATDDEQKITSLKCFLKSSRL